ncbi:MAG: hypothetical protein L6Q71_10540 [Planctomycetes bacterium]|nr:hypothetical protein [Planctomycetota bacterium]
MSEHGSKDQGTKGFFDAAGEIAKILETYGKDEQQRILRLVVEGLSLRDPVAKSQATPEAPTDASGAGGAAQPQAADIKSFVAQKKPKSDQQFATIVAYFYRFVAPEDSRKDAITTDDLQTAGRQARGFAFKTPSATLNNAVKAGYLDKAGRGKYKINAVGENLVAMTLPGAKENGAEAPVRRNKRRGKTVKPGNRKRTRASKKR